MVQKLLLILGLICLAIQCRGHSKEEVIEAMKSFGSSCEPPPTDADAEALVTMDPNPPQSAKCFTNCLMKQTGLLVDGKMDVDMLKNFMSMAYEDKETEFGEIGDGCNQSVNNPDPCELAFEYGVCVQKGMENKGLEIPKVS